MYLPFPRFSRTSFFGHLRAALGRYESLTERAPVALRRIRCPPRPLERSTYCTSDIHFTFSFLVLFANRRTIFQDCLWSLLAYTP